MILWMRNTELNDYVISQSLQGITKKERTETHSASCQGLRTSPRPNGMTCPKSLPHIRALPVPGGLLYILHMFLST